MVPERLAPRSVNLLLRALSPEDFALVEPCLEPVELGRRYVLERPRAPIEHVYFPDTGIVSMVAHADRHRSVEVGIFGREGMSGLAVVMGNDRSSKNASRRSLVTASAYPAMPA